MMHQNESPTADKIPGGAVSNSAPSAPGKIANIAARLATLRATAEKRPVILVTILAAFALCYYGSYFRCGINFRDEGGTVALLSKRLLEGQRPFLEVELGYNVMWFYPVVGLFKLFGVNFVLLRAYCFALSTVTAILGFFTILRVSRRPWLAFLAGLLLVVAPGMTFKNYMPLMAVSNIFCLVHFALAGLARTRKKPMAGTDVSAGDPAVAASPESAAASWRWLVCGAGVLGLTLLIRVDVGVFFTILWLGAITLAGIGRHLGGGVSAPRLRWAPLVLASVVLAIHLPVWLDAHHRGFDGPFVAQYVRWPRSIIGKLTDRFRKENTSSVPRVAAPPNSAALDRTAAATPVAAAEGENNWDRNILSRLSWRDFLHARDGQQRLLFVLLYAPLCTLIPLIFWALFQLRNAALRTREPAGFHRALAALLALGGALTVFPQYFFFRPDAPHLSEFSPGFWVAVFTATVLLGASHDAQTARKRWPARLLCVVLTLHVGAYLCMTLPDRWTGTIAARNDHLFRDLWRLLTEHRKGALARNGRTHLFHGENGVNVFLTKSEFEGLTQLVKVIRDHSGPGDYLLAYPYHPAINLIVNLPTYEIDLYVDNATRSKTWETGAILRLQQFRPAVIVLSDWKINGTDDSRFSVWAARTKAWIQAHYDFQGRYMGSEQFELYTRRPQPAPAPAQ